MLDRADFLQARCGSVGASDVPDVVRRQRSGGASATRGALMARKAVECLTGKVVSTYQSRAMLDGIMREPEGRSLYEVLHDVEIEEVPPPGIVPHPLIAGTHASPDGYIGQMGLVEIKSPEHAAHMDTLLLERVPTDYLTQIYWQMACTGRQWCDYMSWNPDFPLSMRLWKTRVHRDGMIINDLESEVKKFLAELVEKVDALRRRFG